MLLWCIVKNKNFSTHFPGGRSQVVRQWIVTPSFAGSNPVVRPIFILLTLLYFNSLDLDPKTS